MGGRKVGREGEKLYVILNYSTDVSSNILHENWYNPVVKLI